MTGEEKCASKRAYKRRREAEIARSKQEKRHGRTGLNAFRCKFCGLWHLGHKVGWREGRT